MNVANPDVAYEVSINPATLEEIGRLPLTTQEEFTTVFNRARDAQKIWAQTSYKERASYVLKMADYIRDNADELAGIISQDNGKLKIDALNTEVIPSIMSCTWYAKNAPKVLKDELLPPASMMFFNKWSKRVFQPIGVLGIISPWNYPFSIPFGELVMGLMAGNAVVLKVAAQTPMVGEAIERVVKASGLPDGLFTHVVGSGSKVLSSMLENGADKIFFTGSTFAGKQVMKSCAEYLVPCSLELGGNDAMIVLEDAPIERAVNGGMWAAYQNAGQSCGGVKRVYVHEKVYDDFIKMAVAKTKALRHGDNGHDADMGSVTTEKQFQQLEKELQMALDNGAQIAAQSQAVGNQNGYFFPATLLTDVTPDMEFMQDEIFGPFMPVVKVSSEAEAIELANKSQYGLTASVWTRNNAHGKKVAKQLHAGAVTVNDHLYTHGLSNTEWGGPKESGIGRTHGALGLLEVAESKIVNWDILPTLSKNNAWWFPFDEATYETMLKMTAYAKPRSAFEWIGLNLTVIPKVMKKMMSSWKVDNDR
ncbi:aldehyde dehydrogenase family protein [Thalassolituus sp.]|uniref:aldehyde dehydrogenase family protein n=1 Tax=Thalassolituus sp. TaxID=2030822 RepID=UPI00262E1593|nr:aldehyde dehydrogenase family protein [Thalassolituus sp.]